MNLWTVVGQDRDRDTDSFHFLTDNSNEHNCLREVRRSDGSRFRQQEKTPKHIKQKPYLDLVLVGPLDHNCT